MRCGRRSCGPGGCLALVFVILTLGLLWAGVSRGA
jgi:hypothetical protein